MNVQELLEWQAAQRSAKIIEDEKRNRERMAAFTASHAELVNNEQTRQAEWSERQPVLQKIFEQAMAEYQSNLQLFYDTANEATSYILPVLQQIYDLNVKKFPIFFIRGLILHLRGYRDPNDLGNSVTPEGPHLKEYGYKVTPATYLSGELTAQVVWGNVYPVKYYKTHWWENKAEQYVKQDSSEFAIKVDLDEIHLDRFGMLDISAGGQNGDSQIPLLDWHNRPDVVFVAINKALMHPKVTKYDIPVKPRESETGLSGHSW